MLTICNLKTEMAGRGMEKLLDFFEYGLVLLDTHTHQFIASVILIKNVTRLLLQFLHVRSRSASAAKGIVPNEHLSQLDEITVFLVIYFNDTPRVLSPPDDPSVFGFHGGVASYDCKRHLRHDFTVFLNCFVVIEFIAGRLENLNLMMFDVCQDLNLDCLRKGSTLLLKAMTSSSVRVSDFAMTGIKFTLHQFRDVMRDTFE